MNTVWIDNVENVRKGTFFFPMDDEQLFYDDSLNILKFIGEHFTLREYSEGTHWNIPNEVI